MATIMDSYIRTRIDSKTKQEATSALDQLGLSLSDFIRIALRKVAKEKKVPFELYIADQQTKEAMEELERGDVLTYSSIDEMMNDAEKL